MATVKEDDYGLIRLGAKSSVSYVNDFTPTLLNTLFGPGTSDEIIDIISKHIKMFKNTADTGQFTSIMINSPLGVLTEACIYVRGLVDGNPTYRTVASSIRPVNWQTVLLVTEAAPQLIVDIINQINELRDFNNPRMAVTVCKMLMKHLDQINISSEAVIKLYYRIRSSLSSRSYGIRVNDKPFNIIANRLTSILSFIIGKTLRKEGKTNTVAAVLNDFPNVEEKFKNCAQFVYMMAQPYRRITPENVNNISQYALPAIRNRFPFALPPEYDRKLYDAETNIIRASRLSAEWNAGTRAIRIDEVQRVLRNVCDILVVDMPDQAKIRQEVRALSRWALFDIHPIEAFKLLTSYSQDDKVRLYIGNYDTVVMQKINEYCEEKNIEVTIENICVEII